MPISKIIYFQNFKLGKRIDMARVRSHTLRRRVMRTRAFEPAISGRRSGCARDGAAGIVSAYFIRSVQIFV